MSLRLPDSGAEVLADGRRLPASAQRNAAPILQVLQEFDPQGALLEIASGSGLHAALMAPKLRVIWQPSDVDPGNLASITAWSAGIATLRPPLLLDATQPGWHRQMPPQEAVLLVNLLHLIPEGAAAVLLAEVAACLAPQGRAFLYGPFLREGLATSAGDAAFDASLRAQDPAIGYKDLAWVLDRLAEAGLQTEVRAMPANNLMLIAQINSQS
jgi:hypothetical protein